ncbi:putative capsid protein [Avon-Heathcote Estuary associated circular virus 29]|uniref:putative capsid protein n=1 Tax=Avon-Heathcote Estuary associated circular virus 29 TaxID=1618253 RepID=UPI0005CD34DA|nr:putative capsid protein [Avon-Heathcote Estuary associated circular virus 29]AJP36488.1 putative capsid protein [Avon-Heathcote Estuary associated circular virus 29]
MSNTWGGLQGLAPSTIQGTGAESSMTTYGKNRIGNEINMRHWSMDCFIDLPKALNGTPTFPLSQIPCRIILADNLTDDGALQAQDVLQNPLSNAQSLISPYKNSANASKRYKIYADYKFTVAGNKAGKRIHFKMPIPKSGRVVHYQDGASSTPSDFNMSVLFFAEISPAGTNFPNLNLVVKSRFTDA